MYWIARDFNGNLIRQFDENGEHYISELQNKKIISVGYYDHDKDEYYLASLITGNFYFPQKRIETDKDIGGRKFILERQHTIIGNEHQIKYIFGFEKNGKKYKADTDGKEVKEV